MSLSNVPSQEGQHVMHDKEHILKELIGIVGADAVSGEPEDLVPYTRDAYATILRQQIPLPDFVVLPESTDEVQRIVRLANEYRIPLYPRSFGVNIAGSALPYNAGIVIDLKKMNKIIEVNEETMTATIEPGVTWDRLRMKAKEKGLDIIPIGGPYQVSPVGNFLLTNITPYSTKYCMDRVVTLEAVLPNGEIIRTGSQSTQVGAELNPYFRYAYGPDITGLFRGSLGNLGIITRLIIRLRPLAEIENNYYFAFDDMRAVLTAMQKIERLEITRYSQIGNRELSVRSILHPEKFKIKSERQKVLSQLPPYSLTIGLAGKAKQIELYEEMVEEEIQKEGGKRSGLEDDWKQNLDEAAEGCSQKVLHMFLPYGSFGTIVGCAPLSSVQGMAEVVERTVKKYGLRDAIMDEPLTPEFIVIPWDRCSTVYVEHDILYDPLDAEAVQTATKCLRECYVELFTKFGATHTMPNQTFLRLMMPSYVELLMGIKKLVDPNGILLAGGPYSFELGSKGKQ